MNNFFSQCNMVIRSEMSFKKFDIEIKLPFYLHIRDLKCDFLCENSENELEFYGKDIYFQNEKDYIIDSYKECLKYVDLKQFTLEEDTGDGTQIENLTYVNRGSRIFKDTESLYIFLTEYLRFTEIDFHSMKIFVKEQQIKLSRNFMDFIIKEMELGSKSKEPSESFMVLRCAYELNNSTTIFPENTGKSISEFSFRELKTQRVYMSRKCEIEKMQYDEVMKGNSSKK